MRPGFALCVTATMAVSARLALLALLHVLHSLFGVVIRVEGAKQVHIVCGLVNISHLLPFLPLGFHGQAPGPVRRDRGWS